MREMVSGLAVAATILLAPSAMTQTITRCDGCNRPILGQYFEVEFHRYHPLCFKCAECNQPITGEYYTHELKYYDQTCYEKKFLSPCTVCGILIEGEYYEDYWGGRYCAIHLENTPQCGFCERLIAGPIAGNALEMKDGRVLCGICRPSMVTKEATARKLMAEVAPALAEFGIEVAPEQVTIILIDGNKLNRLARNPAHELLGYTDYQEIPTQGGSRKIKSYNMLLLYGMPAAQARHAIAHELMHVWLFGHDVLDADATIVEGSCEYASYLYLDKIGTGVCRYIIRGMTENLDTVYGRGFRVVDDYVATNGVDAWLTMLQNLKSHAPVSME